MAKGRFRSLSVSEVTYNKLREIASRRGFSTLSDTVTYLVTLEELVLRRIESITTSTGNITTTTGTGTTTSGNVTGVPASAPPNPPTATGSTASASTTQDKTKRSAWDILEERGVSCVSEMKGARDPDAVIDRLVEGGAYVVTWDRDRCAVHPGLYGELLKLLPEVRVSDPEKVRTMFKAKDSRLARVFKVLYDAGSMYYDRERGWVVERSAIGGGGGG